MPFSNIADSILQRQSDMPQDDAAQDAPPSLEDFAGEIIKAVKANDPMMLADALRSAIQAASDEQPEGQEQPSPHTYEDQNAAE